MSEGLCASDRACGWQDFLLISHWALQIAHCRCMSAWGMCMSDQKTYVSTLRGSLHVLMSNMRIAGVKVRREPYV